MQKHGQLIALWEYVQTLERQNEAKLIEQQTLYRELQALQMNLDKMEVYYYQNKQLNQEINSLRSVINTKNAMLAQTDQQQHQINFLREENIALQQHLNTSNHIINEMENHSQSQTFKIQRLQNDLTSLNNQHSQLSRKHQQFLSALSEKQEQIQALKQKLYELQREQNNQAQKNLQELAENYEKIELIVIQKDQTIQEMENYINQLEQQCQSLNQEYIKSQKYSKQLEYDIKCLQMKRNMREVADDNLSFLTDSISKVQLMRQNNRMLERIVKYEKQNKNNDNSSQRCAYSECGQAKNNNSPSKLQMRIHTLKMENQNMLRSLAI